MKMCLLCRSSDEWKYDETAARLHQRTGLHATLGKHWTPMKGHPQYELHAQMCELLGLVDNDLAPRKGRAKV